MMSFLIVLLIFVVIAAVILWLVRAILASFSIAPQLANIIYGIVALILLLLFLNEVGWVGTAHGWRRW